MSKANWAFSKLRNDIFTYFKHCPLCLADTGSLRLTFPSTVFGKIHLICSECGAKWHVNYGKTVFTLRFKWAKLVKADVKGRGNGLLNEEHEPEFWQRMALLLKEKKSTQEKRVSPEMVKEKEIVKEVIVKIRCSYCHKLYDETCDECPHCGASR
jgi:hypothetical protein